MLPTPYATLDNKKPLNNMLSEVHYNFIMGHTLQGLAKVGLQLFVCKIIQ